MKIAIMQPYLFPYIGYFQLINSVDKFVVFDDVQFIRGWINRNNIKINDSVKMFTFSLENDSSHKNINQRYYNKNLFENEYRKLIANLNRNYKKNKEFKEIIVLIDMIFKFGDLNVANFNANSLRIISSYLDINTEFLKSSDVLKDNSLKGEEKILSICNKMSANTYINLIGGIDLYNDKRFKEEGIDLYFIKDNSSEYTQIGNFFIPNLSIIDVLMNNNKNEIKKLLNEYELIKN